MSPNSQVNRDRLISCLQKICDSIGFNIDVAAHYDFNMGLIPGPRTPIQLFNIMLSLLLQSNQDTRIDVREQIVCANCNMCTILHRAESGLYLSNKLFYGANQCAGSIQNFTCSFCYRYTPSVKTARIIKLSKYIVIHNSQERPKTDDNCAPLINGRVELGLSYFEAFIYVSYNEVTREWNFVRPQKDDSNFLCVIIAKKI